MESVSVQIVVYAPTVFYHCQHCEVAFKEIGFGDRLHAEQARDALPDDLRDQFHDVAEWCHRLLNRFGDGVSIKLVDAASIEGVWKSLRFGLRGYPAVVVDGRKKVIGSDFAAAEEVIEEVMASRTGA